MIGCVGEPTRIWHLCESSVTLIICCRCLPGRIGQEKHLSLHQVSQIQLCAVRTSGTFSMVWADLVGGLHDKVILPISLRKLTKLNLVQNHLEGLLPGVCLGLQVIRDSGAHTLGHLLGPHVQVAGAGYG